VSQAIRVLVVDDSEFFGTLVAGELSRQYGMETTQTTSAEDALATVQTEQFDCVVSDYDMPEMNGIELFEKIRQQDSDIPFFLLTAAGSEEIASNAITAGVTDYFPKTNREDQFEILGRRIETVISQRRTQRNLERQRRLNETFWNVTQDLMHAPTAEAILECVVTELSSLERVHHCWITPSDHLSIAAPVESDGTTLVRNELNGAIQNGASDRLPGEIAAETKEHCIRDVEIETLGQVSVIGVPLLYRGERYGALSVVTPTNSFSEGEIESVAYLGTTVGHALAAVELQREIARLSEAVEQADPAILLTDADGNIEYANSAFSEISGYALQEAIGSNLSMVATERWGETFYERLWERARAGEQIREEITQRRKDGVQFYANLSVAPLDADSPEEGFVVIESDITELKSREQRLQVLNRVIRHNLRNDLNAASGYLSLVLDEAQSEAVTQYATRARGTVEKLLAVGEKAQFANKVVNESGQGKTVIVPVAETIDSAVDTMRDRHPEAAFETDLEAGLHIQGEYIHAAVVELLSNAVEHNDADRPQITVQASSGSQSPDTVEITVSDNGPGIPELERRTLTEGRETALEHGSSLGLWLVKWIVTHAGGELQFEESALGGSTVRICWPLATPSDGTVIEQ